MRGYLGSSLRFIGALLCSFLWIVTVSIGLCLLVLPHLAMCLCGYDGLIDHFMETMDDFFNAFKGIF